MISTILYNLVNDDGLEMDDEADEEYVIWIMEEDILIMRIIPISENKISVYRCTTAAQGKW